jgi:hypothetical protein
MTAPLLINFPSLITFLTNSPPTFVVAASLADRARSPQEVLPWFLEQSEGKTKHQLHKIAEPIRHGGNACCLAANVERENLGN